MVQVTVKKGIHNQKIRRFIPFYIMMVLPLAYYIIFRYTPMYGAIVGFKDYKFMSGILKSPWADPLFKHFQFFFQSPYFSQLIRNTLILSFYGIIFGVFPPIIFAILVTECKFKGLGRLSQTVAYMPHFLSWVIVFGIVHAFLSQSSGLVNRFITDLGGSAVPFFQSTKLFRGVLVGANIWKETGWGAIIYIAAIAGIDPTLYEAAKMDGTGRLRCIWHITLTGIRPTITILLMLRIGNIMNAGFEQVYMFYNVHVYEVADIIDTWVFRVGLQQLNFSLASAVGLFKSAIGLVLILAANKLAGLWGESLW